MLALADVFVDQVHALAAVLTGVTMALIELVLTPVARVAWHAVTGVAGDAVYAGAVVARVGLAVIDVAFTESTLEPFSTAALVTVGPVDALGSVLARCAGTLVNVDLAHGASEAWLAFAGETVDQVSADAVVYAGIALALVYIYLAVCSSVAGHADTGELSDAVEAGGVILAGHGQTLVDVNLTARAGVATATLALERSLCIHTLSKVLAWVGTDGTLIHVLVTRSTDKAGRACADGTAVQRVGVAHGTFVAGVTDAGIIQVAQQTSFAHWTLAEERRHTVMTCSSIKAHGSGAVVDVLAAVVAGPSVHAHTRVAAIGVEARATVVAGVRLHQALVYVLGTVLTCPLRWALAVVGVDSIYTNPTIHALVARTVIHIDLTVKATESWQASAFISVVPSLMAGPPVEALRWRAGLSKHLTRAPAVARKTLAEKRAMCVHTHASVQALSRLAALVDVVPAVLALEAGWARTVVVVIPVGAAGTVSTWACGAGIDQRAVLTSKASLAYTGILRYTIRHLTFAGGSVMAWRAVAWV